MFIGFNKNAYDSIKLLVFSQIINYLVSMKYLQGMCIEAGSLRNYFWNVKILLQAKFNIKSRANVTIDS